MGVISDIFLVSNKPLTLPAVLHLERRRDQKIRTRSFNLIVNAAARAPEFGQVEKRTKTNHAKGKEYEENDDFLLGAEEPPKGDRLIGVVHGQHSSWGAHFAS